MAFHAGVHGSPFHSFACGRHRPGTDHMITARVSDSKEVGGMDFSVASFSETFGMYLTHYRETKQKLRR